MANNVISVNGKKYAAGMLWQPAAGDGNARAYARALAKSIDTKLNLYVEYNSMVGLGARASGYKNGMFAFAPEVVAAFDDQPSFLAAFESPDGTQYLVVGVRNGVILTDALFDARDAALAEYTHLLHMPDWGYLVAPSDWNIPKAVNRELRDIIVKNVRVVLRPIGRLRTGLPSILTVILTLMLLLYFFREPIAKMLEPNNMSAPNPELVAEYKKKLEEQNKEIDAQIVQKQTPPPAPVMPYEILPDAELRADVCYRAIAFLMQQVTGWIQTDVECDATHASATFRRDFGTLADFYEIAMDLMPGVYITENSESEVNARVKLPRVPVHSSIDEHYVNDVVRDVNTIFQRMNADVDANVFIDNIQNISVPMAEIAAASKLTPPEFIKVFEQFSGVYMAKVSWSARNKTWNYEVIIYGK